MMQPQVENLIEMTHLLKKHCHNNLEVAFTRVLSYFAYVLRIPTVDSLPPMTVSDLEWIQKNCNVEFLKKEMNDWFGKAAYKLGLIPEPEDVYEEYERIQKHKFNKGVDKITIFDPQCKTGAKLMAYYLHYGNDAIYYGNEPNKMMFRIALVNRTLYNLPMALLNFKTSGFNTNINSTYWRIEGLFYQNLTKIDLNDLRL